MVYLPMGITRTLCIIAAFILDCIIGDPQNPYHPIRIIGTGINAGIALYRRAQVTKPILQFLAGTALTVSIVSASYAGTWLLTKACYWVNWWIGVAVEAVLCYFLIAAKCLQVESMKVYRSLEAGDIEGARKNLSFIVGRDTHTLSQQGIIKATVETVAENLSDGVIAPLFFMCIGGPALGMAYKAINTLDSTIGYRNDEYEFFGKFAARLDDAVNMIPARIAALLMILGSVCIRADAKGAIQVYMRDRYKHKSPNSAQTESVCAGALGLCLGGDAYYQGVLVKKPTIGNHIHEPQPSHIIAANSLMYAATISAIAAATVASVLLGLLRGAVYV